MVVELLGDNGLPATIDVNVPHRLLARLVQLRQRLQGRTAVALRLHGQPSVALGSIDIFAHVDRSPPRQFGKHGIERDSLRGKQPTGQSLVALLSLRQTFSKHLCAVHNRRLILVATGIPSLCRGGDRAEIIWSDDEIALFHTRAVTMGLICASDALRLAAATRLRREDLATLTWDHESSFAIIKRAKKRSRGRRRFATLARIPELDSLLEELRGRPRQGDTDTVLVDRDGRA